MLLLQYFSEFLVPTFLILLQKESTMMSRRDSKESLKQSIIQQMQSEESIDFLEDLKRLEKQFLEDCKTDSPNPKTKFSYAALLIRCPTRPQVRRGIHLLEELIQTDSENKRIYFYYMALGNYRLGEFVIARKYTELLLSFEPQNRQARALKALLDEQVTKDGLIGMGIVGGAAIATAALATAGFFLLKGLSK
jgi:fission 1 protein